MLPVTTPFESEALKIGFENSQEAQSLVQLRQPLVAPRGEARSDLQIVFDLATRLGLGAALLGRRHRGGVATPARAERHHAGGAARPSGRGAGATDHAVPQVRRHRVRHAVAQGGAVLGHAGRPRLFTAPDVRGAAHQPSLPAGPRRAVPAGPQLREIAVLLRDPAPPGRRPAQERTRPAGRDAPLHGRGPRHLAGDWVSIDTPHGSVRARAKFNANLDPDVVFAEHGWWEACDELGLPGYPPYGPDSANLNLVLRQTPSDPISGSSPLRASVCDIAPLRTASEEE